jgi:hypothetical protein
MDKQKYKDIAGTVFADLTALHYVRSDAKGSARWMFRCICGREIEYLARQVFKGDNISCGCKRFRNCKIPKLCIHCGLPSNRQNSKGHVASVCQKCHNKQTNGFKTYNPKQRMMASARTRAKACGLPCTVTHRDFEIPEYCPVFGIKLEFGTSANHNASPSLDRILPHLGYVPGNIAVISHRANQIKNSGTAEEHRQIANWIEDILQRDGLSKPTSLMKIVTPEMVFSDKHRAKLSAIASAHWEKKRDRDALEQLFA